MFKGPELEDLQGDHTHKEKMAELIKTKEELKRARDKAMESWLDSRPLIDELEKLQAGLASARNRTSMSNVVASELESQLEATNNSIRLTSVGKSEANKAITRITRAVDEVRQELEAIKIETEQEQKARKKLKQVLKMKKQKLRTLQLTLLAVRMEAEAFGSSKDEATQYVNASQTYTSTGVVKMTQEEHLALIRKAKEETALAEWRVAVSMEQKVAAEASRNLALSRLKDLYLESRLSKNTELKEEEEKEKEKEKVDEEIMCEEKEKEERRGDVVPKARAKAMRKSNRRKPIRGGRSASGMGKKNRVNKKKAFTFSGLIDFLMRSLSCTCGEKQH